MNTPDKFAFLIIIFAIGILFASFFRIGWIFILGAFILWLVVTFIFYLLGNRIHFVLAVIMVFVFSISLYNFSEFLTERNSSKYLNNFNETRVLGMVVDGADVGKSSLSFKVKLQKPDNGLVLVKAGMYFRDVQYGDLLEISGKFQEPENYSDFDYRTYLQRQGIFSIINYPEIKLLERNKGSFIKTQLFQIKSWMRKSIEKIFSEPEAGFLKGLLLGDKQNLGEEFQKSLSNSGTSHLVALSGYNISIIASAVLSLFLFLGANRRRAFWFCVTFILLFVIMVGGSASIVRAGIMGVLLLLGQNLGKIYQPRNALLFAALIMIILNPSILRFDLGFQLSFLATLGLIYFSPWFGKLIKVEKPSFLGWRQNLSTTLSAQLAVMPLLISQFGNFSLVAPFANILVLTLIPITMLLGFIAIILGAVFNLLGSVVGFFAYLILKYEIGVINYFGHLKFSSINLGKYSILFSWIVVVVIFLPILIKKMRLIIYEKHK